MNDMTAFSPELAALANTSPAWPFEEARKLVKRIAGRPSDRPVLFETGYGPSGLPHIGTFGEVARTTMVRHAFRSLTEDRIPTRLIAFSDDMDGLRKVPDNVPNRDMMAAYLGKPLTVVPDPFSNEYPSFGAANNARLRAFLDAFGFEYEFMSATETYTSGAFDASLRKMLWAYDAVMDIILPTLGEERRATYSPFLPICPRTGVVLQVPMIRRDPQAGTVTYRDPETGEEMTTPVTGGRVKCQWKADWALRWHALGVDYEMAGKDLIESVTLSSKICKALGGRAPDGFNYELFLDSEGKKISKSKGNGLTIDEWLAYANPSSLSLYMYREPKAAKRLHFDVIPRTVDEYLQFLTVYPKQEPKAQLQNPVWHIHAGNPPAPETVPSAEGATQVTFGMLMKLASASNTANKETLWGFLKRYAPGVSPETHPGLDELAGYSVRYFVQNILPNKVFAIPDDVERMALGTLKASLAALPSGVDAKTVQDAIYDVARPIPRYQQVMKDGSTGVSLAWFDALYRLLLGEDKGPRFGTFVAMYGIRETVLLIDAALERA
jgi:lysyl-tRNA synthetase class 1